MKEIRKINKAGGTQIYPQTHTMAVVDSNGNTVEERLSNLATTEELREIFEDVISSINTNA